MVTAPAAFAASSVGYPPVPLSVTKKLEKSIPPRSKPSGGIRRSFTSEFTIVVKAAPTTTPTARSTTLPRAMNSRNSWSIGTFPRAGEPTIARLAPDSQTALGRLKAQSTIYRNRLASDVGGVWTEQESDQRRDLFGSAEPLERHAQPRALSPFIVKRCMSPPLL